MMMVVVGAVDVLVVVEGLGMVVGNEDGGDFLRCVCFFVLFLVGFRLDRSSLSIALAFVYL